MDLKSLSYITALSILGACSGDMLPAYPDGTWSVKCEEYRGEESVKSRFNEGSLSLNDVNIWVYDSSGKLVNGPSTQYQSYFTDPDGIDGSTLFPSALKQYDVLVLGNIGEKIEDIPSTLADAEGFRLDFESYDSFISNGFPMASRNTVVPALTGKTLGTRRLVAMYELEFHTDTDAGYDFRLKKVSVHNCARNICPFTTESSAASVQDVIQEGDIFTTGNDDFAKGTGTLYLLENIQGPVFPNAGHRSAADISSETAALASYLQFEGEYRKADDSGFRKVTCRYYFGNELEAFVRRNEKTSLKLRLTKNLLDNDSWTVLPEDWFNNGRVEFSPSAISLKADGNYREVTVNTTDSCGISNNNIRYSLSYDRDAFTSYAIDMEFNTGNGWGAYTDQVVSGPCRLRFINRKPVAGDRYLELYAASADGKNTVMSQQPLGIDVKGYIYPVSLSLKNSDFPNTLNNQPLVFVAGYSDGSLKEIPADRLEVKKVSGKASLYTSGNSYCYHLSDELYDRIVLDASFTDTSLAIPVNVKSRCTASIWALVEDSPQTVFNRINDLYGYAATDDGENYYVSSSALKRQMTHFYLEKPQLCLTNGAERKVVEDDSGTRTMRITGQSYPEIFYIGGSNIYLRDSGPVNSNVSIIVTLKTSYKDLDGHQSETQRINITIL